MANCKFCGKPVRVSTTYHADCMEQRIDALQTAICDTVCKFPMMLDELELDEHCDDCSIVKLLKEMM